MRSRRRNVIAVLADDGDGLEAAAPTRRARKSSSKKRRRPVQLELETDDPGDSIQRARRALKRPRTLLLVAVGLALITAVPWLLSQIPDPAQRSEYRLDAHRIAITPPPRNVPPDLVDQVIRRAKLPEELSLLDDGVGERIARAFAGHPWVAKVVRVRKSFPPQVEVQLEYREPVAMIEVAGGLLPVDRFGVLLPPQDFSAADRERFPLVRGVKSKPKSRPGRSWGDAVVRDAAKLADHLGPYWKELELSAIVVPVQGAAGVDPRSFKYELHTKDGSRILWGRAPGSDHPGELTTEQKIARLKKYRADFGRFDKPAGPYEIDIRHWREITRRPITAAELRGRG